jgi:hypothetical protein
MGSPPPRRQFAYALLATFVVFASWHRWFQSADGGWIFWGSIALFLALTALDWIVTTRFREPSTTAA